jgi:hypothetical protein
MNFQCSQACKTKSNPTSKGGDGSFLSLRYAISAYLTLTQIEYYNTSLEVLKSLYSERETNNVLEYMEKHGKTLFAPVAAKQPAVSCKVFPFNFVPCILRQGPRQYGNR